MYKKGKLPVFLAAVLAVVMVLPAMSSAAPTEEGILGVTGGSLVRVDPDEDIFTVELTLENVPVNFNAAVFELDYDKDLFQVVDFTEWNFFGIDWDEGYTIPPKPNTPEEDEKVLEGLDPEKIEEITNLPPVPPVFANEVTQWGYIRGNDVLSVPTDEKLAFCRIYMKLLAPEGSDFDESFTVTGFHLMRVDEIESNVPGYPYRYTVHEEFDDLEVNVVRIQPTPTPTPTLTPSPTPPPPTQPPGGNGNGGGPVTTPGGGGGTATATPTPTPTPPPEEELPDDETPGYFTPLHIQYIYGYPDGSVRPDNNITRAEVSAVLFRMLEDVDGDKDDPLPNVFPDIPDDEWYTHSVNYLQHTGRVRGYPGGTFMPEAFMTRAEFATIMANFIDEDVGSPIAFPDVAADHWAYQYIQKCSAQGWMIGYPDGSFRPDGNITRAEIVTTLNRILDRRIRLEDIPSYAPSYNDLTTDHWAYADIIEASITHDYDRKEDGYEIWK